MGVDGPLGGCPKLKFFVSVDLLTSKLPEAPIPP